MRTYQLITILGPTASGKTPFAAALADRLDTEIISADSRQIYRGMDIGTGKDLADYTVNGKAIPYHLINICDPGYKYNVFEYQHDFFRAYQAVQEKGKTAAEGEQGKNIHAETPHFLVRPRDRTVNPMFRPDYICERRVQGIGGMTKTQTFRKISAI